jgi:ubiquinone/menaquinone biosynthesis C-methylase UbiE
MKNSQYEVLDFDKVDFLDPIFNSIKRDYPDFLSWQEHALKSSNQRRALVVRAASRAYEGIALLKIGDILDGQPGAGLKISTFKVTKQSEGKGIADLLLSGVFKVAVSNELELIFTTVMPVHVDLIRYLERRSFRRTPAITDAGEFVYTASLTCPERIYPVVNKIAYDLLSNEYSQRANSPGPSQESAEHLANILLSQLQQPIERILELGPGSGDVLSHLSDASKQAIGVEISSNMASIASERAPKALMVIANIFDVNFAPGSFDAIYAGAFIHLFPRPEASELVSKLANWLKPSGVLLINTSIADSDKESIELKTDYLHSVARYRSRWTEESFRKILEDNCFKIIDRQTTDERERKKYWVAYVCRRQQTIKE